jgi:hypothetical protein
MKPFSRKGLHRVTCDDCAGFLYATIAELETRGLPACWCGQRMRPERYELALALGVDHPAAEVARRGFPLDTLRAGEREAARNRRGHRAAPATS